MELVTKKPGKTNQRKVARVDLKIGGDLQV